MAFREGSDLMASLKAVRVEGLFNTGKLGNWKG